MKKNLTFLMMLMAFVGILSAQSGPKFNYQAVVRHADTLYHDQTVDISIAIMQNGVSDPVYQEYHNGTPTTENGFVSIVIGEGEDASGALANVDWKNATVVANFFIDDEEDPMTLTMPVKPVPFALQAGGAILTTENIADYMQNTLTVDGARSVLAAFEGNETGTNGGLQEDVEDAIESFLKTDRAKDSLMVIAKAYLAQLDVEYLKQVYNTLNNNNPFKNKVKELLKDYVENPSNTLTVARQSVKELLDWYLSEYDLRPDVKEDVKRVYHAAQEISPEDKAIIKDTVKNYLSKFAKSPAFIDIVSKEENVGSIVSILTVVISNITENDAYAAFGWFDLKNPTVKDDMRDNILNGYINAYTGTTSSPATTLTGAVTAAVNNEKGHLVKKCTDASHDYCH